MRSLAIKYDDHVVSVTFTATSLHFVLADGREISAPLAWFPRLQCASVADRSNWRLIGLGEGVHWPALDEDVAVKTLLGGRGLGSG
jgi:hypothetical protein